MLPRFGLLLSLAWVLSGCLGNDLVECAGGVICPTGQRCDVRGGCLPEADVAACEGLAPGARCMLAGRVGACGDGACRIAGCGNGAVDPGETCDDGNRDDGDACTSLCALPSCGDGIVDAGEACDDGDANGNDRACTLTCTAATCGDGLRRTDLDPAGQPLEACDDGAANADDAACTLACAHATCGDGRVWAGIEACDDGNAQSGDGCRADCDQVEACDGALVDVGEACDDGNANPADGCDACVATTWRAEVLVRGATRATDRALFFPQDVAMDAAGNLYIADTSAHRVRRVTPDGNVEVFAGSDPQTVGGGFDGDGGPATSASLNEPTGVAVDGRGNVYVADSKNKRVRRIDPRGIITTFAGRGGNAPANVLDVGDGGAATLAYLETPARVEVDGNGAVYIADIGNHRVRRVIDGVIETFAGTGAAGNNGTGLAPASTELNKPSDVALDGNDTVYVVDSSNQRILRSVAGGAMTRVAGGGSSDADEIPATLAQLANPNSAVVAADGTLYFSDKDHDRVRRVDPVSGRIDRVAGAAAGAADAWGFAGDGGPALSARLAAPLGLALRGAGAAQELFVVDRSNQRVRVIRGDPRDPDPAVTTIATHAGTGVDGADGEDAGALSVRLLNLAGVAADGEDLVLTSKNRIWRLLPTGVLHRIAGTGVAGDLGDGPNARDRLLSSPAGLAVDAARRIYVADTENHKVRRLDPDDTLHDVCGTGAAGATLGVDATTTLLRSPTAVAVDDTGDRLLISDTGNHRVVEIDVSTGAVTVVAGSSAGTLGSGGEGGSATAAVLSAPAGVAIDEAGRLYVADAGNHRVVRIDGGILTRVAGTGSAGNGSTGAATSVALNTPTGIVLDERAPGLGDDLLYVVDRGNTKLRRLTMGGTLDTVTGNLVNGFIGDGGLASSASLVTPQVVTIDELGRVTVSSGERLRRIESQPGGSQRIYTIAGKVDPEGSGPTALARLADPRAIVDTPAFLMMPAGASGTLQILRPTMARVETVVGRYFTSASSTSNLARFRSASFGDVGGAAFDPLSGRIFLANTTQHQLLVVDPVDPADHRTWTLATWANTAGVPGFADGPAASAQFDTPTALYFDDAPTERRLYVVDAGNHVVRSIAVGPTGAPVDGSLEVVAGTPGQLGSSGDGDLAESARLDTPSALARCGNGDLFIADAGSHVVRRVVADTGVIDTVLGTGMPSSSGNGAPSYQQGVDSPAGLACDAYGNLFVTSRQTVSLLVANDDGVVDGLGAVQTIYGSLPRDRYPQNSTACLTGLSARADGSVLLTDACTGLLIELTREAPP